VTFGAVAIAVVVLLFAVTPSIQAQLYQLVLTTNRAIMIQRKTILAICTLIVVQLLACTQSNRIYSRASPELAVPTLARG
jgi:hypothetical protein